MNKNGLRSLNKWPLIIPWSIWLYNCISIQTW